jgi:CheY-like chemotaxis protein
MPEMDGLEATQIIRKGTWNERALVNENIRIVAITANVTEENRALYLAAVMNDFISKPIDDVLLHKVIETTINVTTYKGSPA